MGIPGAPSNIADHGLIGDLVDEPLYRVGVAGDGLRLSGQRGPADAVPALPGIPIPTRQRKVALLPTDRMDGKGTGPAALVPRAVMPHVVRTSRRYLKPLSGVFAGAFDAV